MERHLEVVQRQWNEKRKDYYKIRIHGKQKKLSAFRKFAQVVCEKWDKITELCVSAKQFEDNIMYLVKKKNDEL